MIRRILRRLKPYRGWFAWELQAGPLVVQLVHAEQRCTPSAEGRTLLIWRDPLWRA